MAVKHFYEIWTVGGYHSYVYDKFEVDARTNELIIWDEENGKIEFLNRLPIRKIHSITHQQYEE